MESRGRDDAGSDETVANQESGSVDDSLIQWMLGLTYEQRLMVVQDLVDTAWKLANGSAESHPLP